MGGGSLPNVKLPEQLAKVIPTLSPTDGIVSGKGQWCLANQGRDYVIYTENVGQEIEVKFPMTLPATAFIGLIRIQARCRMAKKSMPRAIRLQAKTNVLWLERGNSN